MKRSRINIAFFLVGAWLLVIFVCYSLWIVANQRSYQSPEARELSIAANVENEIDLPNNFVPLQPSWSETLFHRGLAATANSNTRVEHNLRGGVVPHHQVGSRLIIDLLQRVPPTTKQIVWLIPDHYQLSTSAAYTTNYSWQTPFGNINSELSSIATLTQNDQIELNNDVKILQEHALAGLVPYLSYFQPQISLVPVVFNSTATITELDSVIQTLSSLVDQNTVVVAAVDFAHAIPLDTSQQHDRISWQLLEKQQWSQLFTKSDEFFDSPAALYVLGKLMQQQGAVPQLLDTTNSITELQQHDSLGTSYLEVSYYVTNEM